MDALRTVIIDTLKLKFPDDAPNIRAFADLLDEQTDTHINYPAGSILLSILPVQMAPEEVAPYELRANWGLVITGKGASTKVRDADGWRKAILVARVVYSNCWGFKGQVAPAIISSIAKNEQRNKEGLPTGVNYWTITFYNWCRFTAALGEQEY